jgi:hypothetical protein
MTVTGLDWKRPSAAARTNAEEGQGFGTVLLLWTGLTVLILAALWLTGFATSSLAVAVEQGAARVEMVSVGEVGDELIRKAVRSQHATLPFWTVIRFLGDFLGEPTALALRALAAATAFSAAAALSGRPIGYERALAECSAAQGFWVLGLFVSAALMMTLRRHDVETSAALFLPPGVQPAWLVVGLRQLDVFALVGWIVVAYGGCRRGQVGVLGAVSVCVGYWAVESSVRVGLALLIGASMRLCLMPA